jgi:hypothetical protein
MSKKRKLLDEDRGFRAIKESCRAAEQQFWTQQKERLKCANADCDGGFRDLSSAGVGGNPNPGGISLLQIKCAKCSSKKRIGSILRALGATDLAAEHEKLVSEFQDQAFALLEARKPRKAPTLLDYFPAQGSSAPCEVGELPTHTERTTSDVTSTEKSVQPMVSEAIEDVPEASSSRQPLGRGTINKTNVENEISSFIVANNDEIDYKMLYLQQVETTNKLVAEVQELKELVTTLMNGNAKKTGESPPKTILRRPTAPKQVAIVRTATADANEPNGQNASNLVNENSNKSYAAAAKKAPLDRKKFLKKQAQKLNRVSGPPIEFTKIHYQVQDSRPFKKCHSRREITTIIREHLKAINIMPHVFMFSKIGNSIIEIIVPKSKKYLVHSYIEENNLRIIEDFSPTANPHAVDSNYKLKMANRIAFQLKIAGLQNLRRVIRAGIPDDVLALVDNMLEQSDPSGGAAAPMDLENCQ